MSFSILVQPPSAEMLAAIAPAQTRYIYIYRAWAFTDHTRLGYVLSLQFRISLRSRMSLQFRTSLRFRMSLQFRTSLMISYVITIPYTVNDFVLSVI